MARGDAARMRAVLRERLAAALAPSGWIPAAPMAAWAFAGFVRPLDDGVAATASVGIAGSVPDRLPVRVTHLLVGVGYEPLRRLWPLFGDSYHLALLHEDVALPLPEGDPDDEDTWSLQVRDEADAQSVAETIATLVVRESPAFVAPFASADQLLAEFGYGRRGSVDHRVVALLAASGRFEEARDALGRYRSSLGPGSEDRVARQFAHQVARYIDCEGDPAIVPSEPPPSEFDTSERPSVSELWRQGTARDAAVKAVKATGRDRSREELHAALERELETRGLSESPLWFEYTLDHLHDSPAERAELLAKGVMSAATFAFKGLRALREHRPLPDLSVPEWLQPPDRAGYPVTHSSQARWAAVQLGEHCAQVLERAYAAIPRLFGQSAHTSVWLDWDLEDEARLAINLADQRVGTLSRDASAAFREVMARARERDELPYTAARLTPRPTASGYLLDVQLPAD
jgi:hypothetical protein